VHPLHQAHRCSRSAGRPPPPALFGDRSRLFCFHHWIKDFPTFSIKGEFARMGMSTWFCPKCAKEVVRPRKNYRLTTTIARAVTSLPISPLVESVFLEAAKQFKPPPRLSISEWADRNFVLSSEDSAEPGRYRTSRAPYQREILDALGEPEVEDLVLCCAAQTVKTVAIKIWIAYFVKEDPVVHPLPAARARPRAPREPAAPGADVPRRPRAARAARGGREQSRQRHARKSFPGGVLFLVGANSPAGCRACRSASSSPTRSTASRVGRIGRLAARARRDAHRDLLEPQEGEVLHADRRSRRHHAGVREDRHAPATGCRARAAREVKGELDGFQVLDFKNLIIDKDPTGRDDLRVPALRHGHHRVVEDWMLEHGEWRALRPEVKSRRGYQLSALYSPFFTWAESPTNGAARWSTAKTRTCCASSSTPCWREPYNDDAEVLDSSELMARREDYPCPLPDGVTVLTAGGGRAEAIASSCWCAAGARGRSRGSSTARSSRATRRSSRASDVLPRPTTTSPSRAPSPWQRLDEYLERAAYMHARGVRLPIAAPWSTPATRRPWSTSSVRRARPRHLRHEGRLRLRQAAAREGRATTAARAPLPGRVDEIKARCTAG
jgi:hypothetical protein